MNEVRLPPVVVYVLTLVYGDGNTRVCACIAGVMIGGASSSPTAIDRLEVQYGDGAPWALLGPGQLQRAHDASPFDLLLLDRDLHTAETGGVTELNVPGPVLDAVRAELGTGHSAIESAASSSPSSVDAGEMTALILGMLARVVDNAAGASEGLAAVSGQVAEAEAEFWEVDATQAGRYGHAGLR